MVPSELAQIPLFADLSRDELARAARFFREAEVEQGHRLCDRGSLAYEFFVITSGEADVVWENEVVGRLGPGDFFGEVGLLQTERRTTSVVATTPMRVLVSFAGEFGRLLKEIPGLHTVIAETGRRRWAGRDWTRRH